LCGLLCLPAGGHAAPIPAGDVGLRHDIQLLADQGIIEAPVTSWPLSAADLLGSTNRPGSPAQRRISDAIITGNQIAVAVGALAGRYTLRSFAAAPRGDSELALKGDLHTERFDLTVQVNRVVDPIDRQRWRLDGSQAGLDVGNWWLGASAVDRFWGPSWESSLALSNNARPIPALVLHRRQAKPFDLPVLRYLGPWTTQVLWGQLEDDRDFSNTRLFGWRLGFKPHRQLEIGLSRTAQWCGTGRPCSAGTFVDLLSGIRDNRGQNVSAEEEPGNQLAGFDLRYRFSALSRPWSVYHQSMGEDEHQGIPSAYLGLVGLSTWGQRPSGASYRLYAEYANTACSGLSTSDPTFRCAYEHSIYRDGYRYRNRVIGHSLGADGQALAVGGIWRGHQGHLWTGALRVGELNRSNALTNTTASASTDIIDLELRHRRTTALGDFDVGAGAENRTLTGRSGTWYGRFSLTWTMTFD
jgi:hypothetical protein